MFCADLLFTTAAEALSVTLETLSTTVALTQTSKSTDNLTETIGNRHSLMVKLYWVRFVVDLLDLDWSKILWIWCETVTTTSYATNPQLIEFAQYALLQIVEKCHITTLDNCTVTNKKP